MAFLKKQTCETVEKEERKSQRDYAGLVNQLSHANPMARRWAARDLVEHPGAAAALVDHLKIEEDATVREVILTSLTRLGDGTAIAGLVECLRSEDAALRNEAVESMKELPDEVAPIMGGLLADADSDVRIFAVNILESLRHPYVETWLLAVIERDAHVNVCAAAADLLSEVGSDVSRDALERLKLRFPNEPYIRFAVDLAINRLRKDPEAICST